MKEKIQAYLKEIESFTAKKAEEAEAFRIQYLGKKGTITALFEEFKALSGEEKRELGVLLNNLKQKAQEKIDLLKESLENKTENEQTIDFTLPVDFSDLGSRHVLSTMRNKILSIFSQIGYTVAEASEIEDDWHNFSALNFPPEHPARDMQDTFFIEKGEEGKDIALRTHTSSVQVRVMETQKPPIRIIAPGRVFRNEAISARAHCIFHQVEGLYIDKNVSFTDMKQTLLYFVKEMFGETVKMRLRPSYFPFTEPSAEMDISCNICGGEGCNICKGTGWVEILGCGMVDPNVLQSCGIDPNEYSGFAFGMGIERMTMIKYQIRDLRLYFENDLRFSQQFENLI